MNEREFRKHLTDKRLARLRTEAQAENRPTKKPPATAKPQKIRNRRSA